MPTKKQTDKTLRVINARVDLPSTNDVRKGVNVLSTSDPKNPALNPFVQSHNTTVKQGTERPSKDGQAKSKSSD
jgi:hypothetical protein